MEKDRVTLKAAGDYGRRCTAIGKERRKIADLQDAMNHPDFKVSHHALLDRLAAEFRQSKSIIERPPWKTIKLGTGPKIADDFRKALKRADCNISDWANDILGKSAFTASKTETEIELVVVSVAELGFKNGATRADIYNRAAELGLGLCPAEVGPQLRLQYKDQPNGEWLLVAMEPITDSDGDLGVFSVEHDDGGLWLLADYGYPVSFWRADDRWVFVRRK